MQNVRYFCKPLFVVMIYKCFDSRFLAAFAVIYKFTGTVHNLLQCIKNRSWTCCLSLVSGSFQQAVETASPATY